MERAHTGRLLRIYGEEAVLSRLEKLGAFPRTLENLIRVGFQQHQLDEARHWFQVSAVSHVQHYAADRMANGFFEDESLLDLFCRFFQCSDWKLERSPWFFSQDDYRKFTQALIEPLDFFTMQLEAGKGQERWGGFFQNLPFDLGMDRALTSLFEEITTREYYWRPQTSYLHLRAANLLAYLSRTVEILEFSEHHFNYHWERRFRRSFKSSLDRFRVALERAARVWLGQRREKKHRFNYGDFQTSHNGLSGDLLIAFQTFGLEPATASLTELQKCFRKLSKQHHPDHGGLAEDFQRLSAHRSLVESWLREAMPTGGG